METWINSSTSTEHDVCRGIMLHGLEILEHCVVEDEIIERYQSRLDKERLNYPLPKRQINSNNWFLPEKYKNIDIEQYLIDLCPKDNLDRLMLELSLFKKNNMIMVLKSMKFLVDTMREHNILWGVGRGSSVASYALFLIGVHKIDSIKYNLSITEFFKGE